MKNKLLNYGINIIVCFLPILPVVHFQSLQAEQSSAPYAASVPAQSMQVFKGRKMTLDYEILVGGPISMHQKETIEALIEATFHEIDTIYNKWNPYSEISKINQLKANQKIKISPKLETFLKFVDQIVRLTEGRFDPTIEPLQALWKKNLSLGKTPTQEEINKILPAIGWNKIHMNSGKIWKEHDITSLDLGGIAKGYCVDLLTERLVDAGFKDIFVNWEGEIRVNGMHPEHRPWKVMVSRLDDDNPDQAIAHFNLYNQSIATSGDYIQNWKIEQDAKETTYFHIMDPLTGKPLASSQASIASATVIAPSCALADALATTAMMFSNKKDADKWAKEILRVYPTVHFKFYTRQEK